LIPVQAAIRLPGAATPARYSANNPRDSITCDISIVAWVQPYDAALSEMAGLAIVCPITSRVRPFPSSVMLLAGLPVSGEVVLSQIRSIDVTARPVRYAGANVPIETRQWVRANWVR